MDDDQPIWPGNENYEQQMRQRLQMSRRAPPHFSRKPEPAMPERNWIVHPVSSTENPMMLHASYEPTANNPDIWAEWQRRYPDPVDAWRQHGYTTELQLAQAARAKATKQT